MITLTQKQISTFRKQVLDYYSAHKRDLPWRQTTDPYKIMVSEIMLQQTQMERVIPKYLHWIERFPDSKTLASSTLKEVLTHWSGLGYNRRGQNLLKAAQMMEREYVGSFNAFKIIENYKKDPLTKLPGIGPYTAAAIRAFAFNQPIVMIETNIRTVYIHHFFPNAQAVSDKELMPLIEVTLDRENPKDWYNALMDYGSFLKLTEGNASKKSKSYAKQSQFMGSKRRLRGLVIKHLTMYEHATANELKALDVLDAAKLKAVVQDLLLEGMISVDNRGCYSINETHFLPPRV